MLSAAIGNFNHDSAPTCASGPNAADAAPAPVPALTCFQHAVLGLRWFCQNADVTAPARDAGISRATGYRYLEEVITVLADQASDLHDALRRAKAEGLSHVILDGKVFSADHCAQ